MIGTTIFHRLCFKNPAIKEQMKRVPLPPSFSNHDSFMKAHCKALADLVDQVSILAPLPLLRCKVARANIEVVENLDSLEHMTEELESIGRTHARLLRGEINGQRLFSSSALQLSRQHKKNH